MDPLGFANNLYLSSSVWRSGGTYSNINDSEHSAGTLKRLSIEAVLHHPPLIEEISTHLPQQLRKEMINIGLRKNVSYLTLPLFYTWSNPVLALQDLFDEDQDQNSLYYREISLKIIVTFLTEKVISIKTTNSKSVRLIDLTGCLVARELVEQLVENKFCSTEKVTLILDVFVSSSERGYSKWVSLLEGSDHLNIKVNNLWVDNVRESQRNALLSVAHSSNQSLSGLKISKLGFEDWPELYRGLTPLLQFSSLCRLDLSGNNLIDSSDTDVTGREWINNFLKKFPLLKSLDLSRNKMAGKVESVLSGLTLSFVSLSECDINYQDLAFILGMKSLKHLDISGLYRGLSFHPITERFNDISSCVEILNIGFWQPRDEEFNIIHKEVLTKLVDLQYLDLSSCSFNVSQTEELLKLRIQTLEFNINLNCHEGHLCDCTTRFNDELSELLKKHGYSMCNIVIKQDQFDKILKLRAILH